MTNSDQTQLGVVGRVAELEGPGSVVGGLVGGLVGLVIERVIDRKSTEPSSR
jgi:hypothetical protein